MADTKSKGSQKLPTEAEVSMADVKKKRNQESSKKRKLKLASRYKALTAFTEQEKQALKEALTAKAKKEGLSLRESGELDFTKGRKSAPQPVKGSV